jgi:hypothetical protein
MPVSAPFWIPSEQVGSGSLSHESTIIKQTINSGQDREKSDLTKDITLETKMAILKINGRYLSIFKLKKKK